MKYRFFLLVLIMAVVVSCKDDAVPPVFTEPVISSRFGVTPSYHKATIVDTVTLQSDEIVVRLFYSTDKAKACTSAAESVDTKLFHVGERTKMTSELEDLTDGTTYYYAYGYISQFNDGRRDGLVTKYSDVREFTTLKNGAPDVKTIGHSDVGFFSAVLSVEKVSDNSDSKTTAWGICYGTGPNPTVSNGRMTSSSNDNGTKNFTVSSLDDNTKYYYRAYGINKYGTSYGEEKSFTTVSTSLMTVVTEQPSAVGNNNAIMDGTLSGVSSLSIKERGFYYSSTSQTPGQSDMKASSDVGGLGPFQCVVTGLTKNTKYYVRAFAVCQYGELRGEVVSFTTGQ